MIDLFEKFDLEDRVVSNASSMTGGNLAVDGGWIAW